LVPPPVPPVLVGSYLQPLYVNIVEAGGQTVAARSAAVFGVPGLLTVAILLGVTGDSAHDECGFIYGTAGSTACGIARRLEATGGYPPFESMGRPELLSLRLLWPDGDKIAHAPWQRAFCNAMLAGGFADPTVAGTDPGFVTWQNAACPPAFMKAAFGVLAPGQVLPPPPAPNGWAAAITQLSPVWLGSFDSDSFVRHPNYPASGYQHAWVQYRTDGGASSDFGYAIPPNIDTPPSPVWGPDLTAGNSGSRSITLNGSNYMTFNGGGNALSFTETVSFQTGDLASYGAPATLMASHAPDGTAMNAVQLRPDGKVQYFHKNYTGFAPDPVTLVSPGSYADGAPHVVVVSFDQVTGEYRLRIDAQDLASSGPGHNAGGYGLGNWRGSIGWDATPGFDPQTDKFVGNLDSVAVFARVLSPADLRVVETLITQQPAVTTCPPGQVRTWVGVHAGDCSVYGGDFPPPQRPPATDVQAPPATVPGTATQEAPSALSTVSDYLLHLGDRLAGGLLDLGGFIVNGIRSVLVWGFDLLAGLLRIIIGWLMEIARLLNVIAGGIGSVVSSIGSLAGNLLGKLDWLAGQIGGAIGAVPGLIVSAITLLKTALLAVLNGISTLLQQVLDAVTGLATSIVNGITGGITGLFVPEHVGERADEIGAAYNGSGVPSVVAPVTTVAGLGGAFAGVDGGDCLGPSITFPTAFFGGYVWHPLDACDPPLSVLATALHLGLAALIFVGAAFFYYRAFMTVSGLGVGLDIGEGS